jgi:hypothetical protein
MKFSKIAHRALKESLAHTKKCYVLDCKSVCIKAHSISNSRYLKKISKDGRVLYMKSEGYKGGHMPLEPIGRAQATTFRGFCDVHDKYFEPVDTQDYFISDLKMNFLFAFRAAAREYTVRQGAEKMIRDVVDGKNLELAMSSQGKLLLEDYLLGFSKGTSDLENIRIILNNNFLQKRYWKLNTEVLILVGEYPIVASSIFKIEKGPDGAVINDIKNLKSIGRPCFLTLFPQEGRTFCILSWFRKDNQYYQSLSGMNNLSDKEKKVVISNLLISYVENFAVNPDYWSNLAEEVVVKFSKLWRPSMEEGTKFVTDNEFSLFV